LLVAVAGFVGISALSGAVGGGPDAVSVLYVVPVAALALRNGAIGGVMGLAVAIWLLAGMALMSDDIKLSALGFASRVVSLVISGPLLGTLLDRLRRVEALVDPLQRQVAAHDARAAYLVAASNSAEERVRVLALIVDAKRAAERNDPSRALTILESAGGSANDLDKTLPTAPVRDVV
jgi:hypothetical protein